MDSYLATTQKHPLKNATSVKWGALISLLAIWALTATGKIITLVNNPPILQTRDSIFQMPYHQLLKVATFIEILVLAVYLFAGRRMFASVSFVVSGAFALYHLASSLISSSGRCNCLGALLDWSPFLARMESEIAIILLVMTQLCAYFCLRDTPSYQNTHKCGAVVDGHSFKVTVGLLTIAYAIMCYGILFDFKHINLGSDEGLELGKALLLVKRPNEWFRIWNDQPLLYTKLLSLVIDADEPQFVKGRFISLVLGLGIPVFAYLFYKQCSMAIVTGFALLLAWQHQSTYVAVVSMIPEVPAYSIGLLAAALLLITTSPRMLWCSGMLAGFALHIKFTALFSVILCPVILLMDFSMGDSKLVKVSSQVYKACMAVCKWLLACAMTFITGVFLSSQWSWAQMFKAHNFSSKDVPALIPSEYMFSMITSLEDWPLTALALVGIVLGSIRKHHRQVIVALTLLCISVIVHSWHVPWWWYYSIHIAFPLALLAGLGVHSIVEVLIEGFSTQGVNSVIPRISVAVLSTSMLFLVLVRSVDHCVDGIHRAAMAEPSNSGTIARELKRLSPKTRWAFGTDHAKIAYAGLVQPPEVLILSKKRFWSKQISTDYILKIVSEYMPEQVILRSMDPLRDSSWNKWLQDNYVVAAIEDNSTLYVNKNFHSGSTVHSTTRDLLQKMGM